MPLFTQYLTVQPWQRALERLDGARTVVLEPGRHPQRTRASYQVLDVREQLFTLAPQEVLTADGVSLKVTAALRWRVADPVTYTETVADPLFAGLPRRADRAARGPRPARDRGGRPDRTPVGDEQPRRPRSGRAGRRHRGARGRGQGRDPAGELRAAYGAVVTAAPRAQAQLEAARAETAALRSLANGAKLLDDHPALAQLRMIQSLPIGSTIELTLPGHD